jgi:aspartate 1-decarboxylase
MLRTVCKSKIHRATVTEANVEYAGSLTLDAALMRAADLVPYEQVHVVDVDNGARLVTYCIEAPAGSGTVCVNGAAARLIGAGERIIVIAYGQVTPEELEAAAPKVVLVDQHNRIRQVVTEGVPPSRNGGVGAAFNTAES